MNVFESKYTAEQIEALLDKINNQEESSGGGKKYLHCLRWHYSDGYLYKDWSGNQCKMDIRCNIITNSPNPLTISDFVLELKNHLGIASNATGYSDNYINSLFFNCRMSKSINTALLPIVCSSVSIPYDNYIVPYFTFPDGSSVQIDAFASTNSGYPSSKLTDVVVEV